jgi:hypothetical protein
MNDQPEPKTREGLDLLSVALLIFFVALLVLVAALTLLPIILG